MVKTGTRFQAFGDRMKSLMLSLLVLSVFAGATVVPAASASPITLASRNPQHRGSFGYSVAASGDLLIVGTPFETAAGQSRAGHAYVFNRATGVLLYTLTSPHAQMSGFFGYSVAVSGSSLVVGAPDETAGGQSRVGNAYIFDSIMGALTSTLTSPNPRGGGEFGRSVAMSSAVVVVGAPAEIAGGQGGAGHAYTFDPTKGALIRTLASPNPQVYGGFGFSVAASGNLLVVGAPGETAAGQIEAGNAYTFNSVTGVLTSTLTSTNAQNVGSFGYSVAMSQNSLIVGAPTETSAGQINAGHAYTFDPTNGALIRTLTSPNPQFVGYFGYSVAANGKIDVVGAPFESANGLSGAGHVYVFSAAARGAGIGGQTTTSPNAQTNGNFGFSLAAGTGVLVVGAPGETASGLSGAGRAYILLQSEA